MQTALTYRTNRDLFSNYYLDEHLPETEEWDEVSDEELEEAYDDIMDLWEREKDTAPKRNESQLEEKFIRPMFRKLGIPFEVEESTSRTQRRPDYGFFETEEAARDAFQRRDEGLDFYKNSVAVADAKRWGRPLDTRGSGEHNRDFENPSYQIHVYLQETPARWAVLTDGKKWRLYYGPTSHRLDSYYEVDLPTILESGDLEDFKYFYLFFRHEAFLEDSGGDCFLDDVYGESNVFAQELGEDLQDNIYEAIKILSEGFLQYPDNDLDESDLERIHDSSLIYLYRLIFVLYAEAEGRELLDTSNEIYEQSYSLNSLKQEVAEELDSGDPKYRGWQDNLQSRLDELFTLIDKGSKSRGIPEEDLYIPAYNGGLFRTDPDEDDSPEAKFLANHDVGDAYLAKVVELLTRSKNSNGGGKIFVDYSSLDVRHLGSIYEGLLEYQLNVADEPLALDDGEYVSADEGDTVVVQEGEVHLTTGSGERKATGSYYTPEYVVEYIVENTLEPLVSDIRTDLAGRSARGDDRGFAEEFAERIFDLKILDPAMGSGHFLTSAIDYLAREIIDAQEKQAAQQGIETVDEAHDINWARRQVAQRCIYGVDLNPLAVELAKVSLWLRTLAAEQPLAFLDHHLKTGNSLVGSDIEEIEELESESGGTDKDASLADFGVARKGTIEQLMRIYEDFIAIENQELADVKEMESKYDEFERNKLRQRLEALTNVKTAENFGLSRLPSDAYERMAAALEDDNTWEDVEEMEWFETAQQWASDDNYFHWKLEYPEVFYGSDGSELENSGFDAVIGNPPYVKVQTIPETLKDYLVQNFGSARGKFDLYMPFVEQASELTGEHGRFSQIVPSKFTETDSGKGLRKHFFEDAKLTEYLDFIDHQVFPEATTYTCIITAEKNDATEDGAIQYTRVESKSDIRSDDHISIPYSELSDEVWSLTKFGNPVYQVKEDVVNRADGDLDRLDNVFSHISKGIDPGGSTDIFVLEESEAEEKDLEANLTKELIPGDSIDRWAIDSSKIIIFPYKRLNGSYQVIPEEELKGTNVYSYLSEFKEDLSDRDYVLEAGKEWYELWNERQPGSQEVEKLVICNMSKRNRFAYDEAGRHTIHTTYSLIPAGEVKEDILYLLAVMNSRLLTEFFTLESTTVRGGYYRYNRMYLKDLPIKRINPGSEGSSTNAYEEGEQAFGSYIETSDEDALTPFLENVPHQPEALHDLLVSITENLIEWVQQRSALNLNLLDYLGNYSSGKNLMEISGYQPAMGASESILSETTESYENLRVGNVEVEVDGAKTIVKATARYKPEDEEGYETDQWGYTETDPMPVMEFVGVGEKKRELLQEFVPYAVDESGGFANFRENATKTNSLIDRLNDIELPEIDDVQDGLEQFISIKGRATELDNKINKSEKAIDHLIYRLYDLSEGEIELVENTSG